MRICVNLRNLRMITASSRLGILLVLGRVSNLPTVWSNCLAAWMLAGGAHPGNYGWPLLIRLVAGCTALYLGGMYLNDAFDVAFDERHRPERPIPSGRISRRAVAILGAAWMLAGLLALASKGGGWAWGLAGLILFYDAVHKKTAAAPLLMAGCRALIYPLVAAAVTGAGPASFPAMIWVASACMGIWVLILSVLARSNSRWSAPVPNLLAGIPLLDLLLVSPHAIAGCLPFAGFAGLALVLRRNIPPT